MEEQRSREITGRERESWELAQEQKARAFVVLQISDEISSTQTVGVLLHVG